MSEATGTSPATGQILPAKYDGCSTLTVEEAASVLRLSRTSAYAAVRDRTLPSVKIGRRYLVPRVALERLLGGV